MREEWQNPDSVEAKQMTEMSVEQAMAEVEKTVPAISTPDTALPAIKFSLFNFFRANPNYSTDDLDREIAKMSALGAREEIYKCSHKVPTVGTEVEFPTSWLKTGDIKILNELGVRNEPELSTLSDKLLWEVNQGYSYSASVQARVLQELGNAKIIHPNEHLSLHINLGTPDYLKDSDKVRDDHSEVYFFINSSTIAFTTTERMEKRKRYGTYTLSNEDVKESDRGSKFRFEIKSHELNDKGAYRAISDIQMLAAGFFTSLKKEHGLNFDEMDQRINNVWEDFKIEFIEILMLSKMPKLKEIGKFMVFKDMYESANFNFLKNNPEVRETARLVFSKHARQVKDILFAKD